MAFKAAKQQHGTVLAARPVKSLGEKETTSPYLAKHEYHKLSTTFETASAVLQLLLKAFFDNADKMFEDEDFKHLFTAFWSHSDDNKV